MLRPCACGTTNVSTCYLAKHQFCNARTYTVNAMGFFAARNDHLILDFVRTPVVKSHCLMWLLRRVNRTKFNFGTVKYVKMHGYLCGHSSGNEKIDCVLKRTSGSPSTISDGQLFRFTDVIFFE